MLMQGLSDAVLQRMGNWRFDPSCTLRLTWLSDGSWPQLPIADLGSGVEAALRQLSPTLMPGSVLQIHDKFMSRGWEGWLSTVLAAVATATPTMPHVTVLAPYVDGCEKAVTMLGEQDPPVQHVAFTSLYKLKGVSHVPWPWQSLTVTPVVLSEFLELPDPRGGVYDVRLSVLIADCKKVRYLRPKHRDNIAVILSYRARHAIVDTTHACKAYA